VQSIRGNWIQSFVEKGGFTVLYNLLKEMQLKFKKSRETAGGEVMKIKAEKECIN